MVRVNINGVDREVDAEPNMPLLWAIRDVLGMLEQNSAAWQNSNS